MPQLMPLMWCNSVMMGFMLIFMLIEMFYYKFEYSMFNLFFDESENMINYKW